MFLSRFILSDLFRRTVLLSWLITIIWLSLDPSPPVPEHGILSWDKFLHAFAYGSLTLFGGWALSGHSSLRISTWCKVACGAILLGIIMELLQMTFTVTRIAEFGDILANSIGAGIVLLCIFCFKKCSRYVDNLAK